jgi:hypothetical protein
MMMQRFFLGRKGISKCYLVHFQVSKGGMPSSAVITDVFMYVIGLDKQLSIISKAPHSLVLEGQV